MNMAGSIPYDPELYISGEMQGGTPFTKMSPQQKMQIMLQDRMNEMYYNMKKNTGVNSNLMSLLSKGMAPRDAWRAERGGSLGDPWKRR